MSEKEQVKEITWLGEEQSITVEKDLINVEYQTAVYRMEKIIKGKQYA